MTVHLVWQNWLGIVIMLLSALFNIADDKNEPVVRVRTVLMIGIVLLLLLWR